MLTMGKALPWFWEIQSNTGWMDDHTANTLRSNRSLSLVFRSLVWSEVSCELLNMEALIPKSQNMREQVIDLCLYLKSHMIWMHIKVWEPLAILVNIWRWMLCGCCVNTRMEHYSFTLDKWKSFATSLNHEYE